jgi:hypothetical protein
MLGYRLFLLYIFNYFLCGTANAIQECHQVVKVKPTQQNPSLKNPKTQFYKTQSQTKTQDERKAHFGGDG